MHTATMIDEIKRHMEVVGSEDVRVGRVDRVEGDYIKLTRKDSTDGLHHYIDAWLVERVDDKVHLARPANEVMQGWGTEF
jgi:hypothetical protein